jgi:chromatin remodeling complex protein RSC6
MESTDSAQFVIPNDDSMHSAPDSEGNANNDGAVDGARDDADGRDNAPDDADGRDNARDDADGRDNFEGEGNAPEATEPSPQECILMFKEEVEALRKRPRSENIPTTIPEREVFQRISSMIRVSGLAAQRKALELSGLTSLSKRIRRVCLLIVSHEVVSSSESHFTWKLRARAVLPDSSPISISDFAKRVFIETENNVEVGEWNASKSAGSQPVDEFVITRTSPLPTVARIHISLDADPPIFRLHQKLATLLGLEHETMLGIVSRIMGYVSQHSLQDADDRRYINCDQELHEILGAARIAVCHIQKLIEKHIDVCEAFVVPYELSAKSDTRVYEGIIDTHRDPVTAAPCLPPLPDAVFDSETMDVLRKIHTARTRHQFFSRLANNPREFLTEYVESQSNDVRVLQQGGGLSQASREEASRARLWQQPWVEESVASYVIRSFK